ncbi:MAG: glycosyltransferase [Phycisphaeraceae bacterium]
MHHEDPHIDALIRKHEGSWRSGYDAFPALVHKHGLRRGVEVGVAFGGHAAAILERGGVDKLFGVDRYQHRDGYDDPMNLPQPVFDRLAQRVVERMKPFGSRFELVREESVAASERFEDGALDFVYLDADHSETGLLADLSAWFCKVREGGIVAGHDLDHPDFPGVRRAVERFFVRFGWLPEAHGHGVWTVQKRARPVTFFTPAYNAEPFIAQAVHSIMQGNLRTGDRYLVVDDASTDQTAGVVEKLVVSYPEIELIRHDKNRGGGAARNTAIAQARTGLLFCLDADNVLLPGSVDRLRHAMDRDPAEVACFARVDYFRGEANTRSVTHAHNYAYERYNLSAYLATGRVPGASGNYLFARSSHGAAGGYPTQHGALDTWGFGLRQVAVGGEMLVVPNTSYLHRDGHGSYWTRYAKTGVADEHAFDLLSPYLDQLDPRDASRLASPRRRAGWFGRLDDKPIRVRQRRERALPAMPAIQSLPRSISNTLARLLNRQAA